MHSRCQGHLACRNSAGFWTCCLQCSKPSTGPTAALLLPLIPRAASMQQFCRILDLQPSVLRVFCGAQSRCLVAITNHGHGQPARSNSTRKGRRVTGGSLKVPITSDTMLSQCDEVSMHLLLQTRVSLGRAVPGNLRLLGANASHNSIFLCLEPITQSCRHCFQLTWAFLLQDLLKALLDHGLALICWNLREQRGEYRGGTCSPCRHEQKEGLTITGHMLELTTCLSHVFLYAEGKCHQMTTAFSS